MSWIACILSGIAAWLLWDNSAGLIGWAITSFLLVFWSAGVAHNIHTGARLAAAKNTDDPVEREQMANLMAQTLIPGWLAFANFLGFVSSVAVFITSLIV